MPRDILVFENSVFEKVLRIHSIWGNNISPNFSFMGGILWKNMFPNLLFGENFSLGGTLVPSKEELLEYTTYADLKAYDLNEQFLGRIGLITTTRKLTDSDRI